MTALIFHVKTEDLCIVMKVVNVNNAVRTRCSTSETAV